MVLGINPDTDYAVSESPDSDETETNNPIIGSVTTKVALAVAIVGLVILGGN